MKKEKNNKITSNEKALLEVNANLISRLALGNKTHGGKRDMYEVLGYTPTLTIKEYANKYRRNDIARRIVDAYPDAVWTQQPSIETDDNKDIKTPFEKAFDDMAKRLKLFHYLNRADKLSGLGRYSVLLIGVNDGKDFKEPLEKVGSIDSISYLMPFSEVNAQITVYDTDVKSERYGLPKTYTLQTGGYAGDASSTMPETSLTVDHSRVIHIAEGTLENDVFGTPRLEAIYNRLEDLEKVVGGSSEIFWLNGRGGINLNADKETTIDDPEKLQEHAEAYINQLTRILKTQGMDVKTLNLAVDPPDRHVSVLLDLICGTVAIPKRIIIGSERGELASSQDENNWSNRIIERRENFCEPLILRPFIDKMIEIGALPNEPSYDVIWPDLTSVSENDKAEIASKKAAAIASYVNAVGADLMIPPEQFVTEIMGLEFHQEEIDKLLAEEREAMENDAKLIEQNPDE